MSRHRAGQFVFVCGLLCASLNGAVAASGRMVEKLTPDIFSEALDSLGLKYQTANDPRGYPMVIVDQRRLPVQQFNILFFGCNAKGECEDVALWSWYKPDHPVSDRAIFAWNNPLARGRRWTTGYVDDQNDPALVLNINATGGIGEEALKILVNTYVQDLFDFKKVVDASAKTAANEGREADTSDQPVTASALLPSDVHYMTALIKKYGAGGYARTKQSEVKH